MSKVGDLKAKYEAERRARVEKYGLEIQKLYSEAIDAASLAADGIELKPGVFKLSKYADLNARVDKIIAQISGKIETVLYSSIAGEWATADLNNDSLFAAIYNKKPGENPLLSMRNESAFNAFRGQVDKKGFNISKRIYKYTGTYKQELETGLGDGIANGKSAAAMARDLKDHLLEPDKLFRRVKKDGKLRLSKPALDYHPGQGVYRSSYKNIYRLTRDQTNQAYRKADNIRYQNSPFIYGFEVRLSNRHPTFDMCDQLKGKYPKTFLFLSWHAQCLCFSVPLMLTPDEFDKMENDVLAGKPITDISKYTDAETPTGGQAKEWFSTNAERISGYKSQPYFLTDNRDFFRV